MGVYGYIDMIVLYSHAFLVRRYELNQQHTHMKHCPGERGR